jgi:DNA-binding LytR/AlgR family response regulator
VTNTCGCEFLLQVFVAGRSDPRQTVYSEVSKMDKKLQQNNELSSTLKDEVISAMYAGRLVPVARSQVQWAQTVGDYVRLHTPKGNCLVRKSLKSLAEQWAEHGFMRTHRFYLVFFPLVTDVWRGPSGYNVRLGSGPTAMNLPISQQYEQEIKQRWTHRGHHENGTSCAD